MISTCKGLTVKKKKSLIYRASKNLITHIAEVIELFNKHV